MENTSSDCPFPASGKDMETSMSPLSDAEFTLGQRVHSVGDCKRVGTVKYVGPVHGYAGIWVGVDWDNGGGKHGGNGYFVAKSERSGSFVRPHKLSLGISLFDALEFRYRSETSREEEDEMYVLSASNKRVIVHLLGREKIQEKFSQFEELTSVSLSCLGVSSYGPVCLSNYLTNLKELDLTGNLLSNWKDVGVICADLRSLRVLNLCHNKMSHDITELQEFDNIHTLVLNCTGIGWKQIEVLKQFFLSIEELHLMSNELNIITPSSSGFVEGFQYLRLLNLEENCFTDWHEIMKLSHLQRLEQLLLSKNRLNYISYANDATRHAFHSGSGSPTCVVPFQNLRCILLGGNAIEDVASIDSLNCFPNLRDIRLSDNPIVVPDRGGLPRFILVARLTKVEVLNGSEVSVRERKESEIRYVRLVMSTMEDNPEERNRAHPRFVELKKFHGIEEGPAKPGGVGLQKLASRLISINLKCIGPSICDRLLITKKLPPTTTVGKLKILCESFFKLGSVKLRLFLQEKGSHVKTLLDDEVATIFDVGAENDSTILVSEV